MHQCRRMILYISLNKKKRNIQIINKYYCSLNIYCCCLSRLLLCVDSFGIDPNKCTYISTDSRADLSLPDKIEVTMLIFRYMLNQLLFLSDVLNDHCNFCRLTDFEMNVYINRDSIPFCD